MLPQKKNCNLQLHTLRCNFLLSEAIFHVIFRAVLKMKIPSYTQAIHLTTLSIWLRSVQCNGLENGGGLSLRFVNFGGGLQPPPSPHGSSATILPTSVLPKSLCGLTWAMFSTVCYSLHCSTTRLLTFPVCWMESGPGIHSTLRSYHFVIFQGMRILWLFLPNWTKISCDGQI